MASAAILAGGQARRFGGADKSALLLDGRSILDRLLDVVSAVTDDVLIVGDRVPHAGAQKTVRHVSDRVPGCGPLGGLDAALDAARDPDVLLLACDMPFLTTAFLRHLVSVAGDADAVVPMTERGYHPVCAVYTKRCHTDVRRALEQRRLSMAVLLRTIRVRTVPGDEIEAFGPPEELLANVNTPAELDRLRALRGHKL